MATSPFDKGALKGWTLQNLGSGGFSDFSALQIAEVNSDSFPSSVTKNAGVYFVSFDDLANFRVCFDTRTVTAFDVGADTDDAALTHLLYDHIAPRILAHQGELVLHGSAVEIEERLVIFLGDTGTGKSTLAASLHRAGHRLLGDDAVIVTKSNGRYFGEAVYSSLRLFPGSASAVLGEGVALAPMAKYSEKKRVCLESASPLKEGPVPISALFYLTGEGEESTPAAYRLTAGTSCIWLIEQSFSLDPHDPHSAAKRLAKVSELAPSVAGFEVDFPYDFDRLDDVHTMIHDCMSAAEKQSSNQIELNAAS